MLNRSVRALGPETHTAQMLENDAIGRRKARERLAAGETYLDLINAGQDARIKASAAVQSFRESYFYPELRKAYGDTAVDGMLLFFKNPRHIEDVIVAVMTGKRATPLCDKWDVAGMSYEAEEFDL